MHSPSGLPGCACRADRGATIQHWQLRDLVHCPDKDDELYCVHRHRTVRHDLSARGGGATSVAQDLGFEVRGCRRGWMVRVDGVDCVLNVP